MNLQAKLELNNISRYRSELFGFGIISIMIFHWCENYVTTYSSGMLWMLAEVYIMFIGSIGVEIFLFLSGIGLCYSMHRDHSVARFYKRRVMRIIPTYLIGGVVYWIIEDLIISGGNISDVFCDLSFLSFWTRGVERFWYVGFIIFLYLIYPAIYRCFDTQKGKAFVRLWLLIFAAVMIVAITYFLNNTLYGNIKIALWRVPIFLAGAYMGERLNRGDKTGKGDFLVFIAGIAMKIFACVCTLGILTHKFNYPNIFRSRIAIAIYAIALVYVLIWIIDNVKWKGVKVFLSRAGGLSLELYITHVAVRSIASHLGFPIYSIPFYCVCMLLAVILAVGLKRITDALRKYSFGCL